MDSQELSRAVPFTLCNGICIISDHLNEFTCSLIFNRIIMFQKGIK